MSAIQMYARASSDFDVKLSRSRECSLKTLMTMRR